MANTNTAQSAASSLLSQSFFRQKMEEATLKIIEKLTSELEARSKKDDPAANDSNLSIDAVIHAGNSLSISTSGDEVSSVRNNTIATESAFSFSQIEHDSSAFKNDDQDEANVGFW